MERKDGGHAFGVWWLFTCAKGHREEYDTLREAREELEERVRDYPDACCLRGVPR